MYDSSFYYEIVVENEIKMIIQFSEENNVYPEEEYMDFESYECWDNDDRYILYRDYTGYLCIKCKTIDGDIIQFEIEEITKLGPIE
jgi:hypothetical protein